MAAEDGSQKYSLMQAFARRAYEFDFYQALRRLEAVNPEKPRIGCSLKAGDDPVHFGQKPSLRFEPSTIVDYHPSSERSSDRLLVAFLGLLGPQGPMPLQMTEYVRSRELQFNDSTLARFLDIFHHRMISLFYRAWLVNQQTASFDRPELDRFSTYFQSIIGMGTSGFRKRDSIDDLAKIHFSGRVAAQPKNAEGLRAILQDYFEVPVQIEEFIGEWIWLPPECCLKLGRTRDTGSVGINAIVGARVWECQHKFRIRMGPMGLKDYQRLLPGGNSMKRLRDWVRNYVGDQFGFEVQLVLKKEEIPRLRPGVIGQLGWTTWMAAKPITEDADDLVLQVA